MQLNTLECGDCIALLKTIPDASVPLIFADPPFNIGVQYDNHNDKMKPAQYLHWCQAWLQELRRVITGTGTFWLAIGPAYVSELDVAAKALGFQKRSHVIWHYTFGVNCVRKLTPAHTHLLYYTAHKSRFTFNRDPVAVPSSRQVIYQDKRAKGPRLPDDVWQLNIAMLADTSGTNDFWYVPRVCGTHKERVPGEPTQMPEEILSRIIRMCSNPGDTVLDPFVGTGTTAAVAKRFNRNYLGIDKSPRAITSATTRVQEVRAEGRGS